MERARWLTMFVGAVIGLGLGCGDKPVGDGDAASPRCGNGVVDPGEVCDDGNVISWDGCSADCVPDFLCDNGVVDVGETCDGDCPTSCDDGDLCTADVLTGSADRCDVRCTFEPISTCMSGDGCCAVGCNAANDDDCVPICGNGVLEPTEECDGTTAACSDVGFSAPGTVPCVDCRATDVSACCAAPVWDVQTVDASNGGGGTSLAMDSAGYPHISYADSTTWELRYAYFDGTDWQAEVVDAFRPVYTHISLALDAADRPHISYAYTDTDELRYAHLDGTAWQFLMIGDGTAIAAASSLALDAVGHPHVSYYDNASLDVYYTSFDGTEWHSQVVDDGSFMGSIASLALDASGRPQIASYRPSPQLDKWDLWYALFDGTDWQIQLADATTGVGGDVSLALDVTDRPHISYADSGNGDLRYAYHDGTAWQLHVVQTGGLSGGDNSLAVDGARRPHIAFGYSPGGQAQLWYAFYDGTDWKVDTVDVVSIAGPQPSLALDVAGLPHISYRNFADRQLKYARLVCP